MSYFHPDAFQALLSKEKRRQKHEPEIGSGQVHNHGGRERVGRAEKGIDAQCVLGLLHSVI